MKKTTALFFALVILNGCGASYGKKIQSSEASKIEPGKTTKSQVADMLGKPMSETRLSNGNDRWVYGHGKTTVRPETYIPVVGAFVGGADSNQNFFIITFSSDGIVKEYEETSTTTGANLLPGSN